MSKEILSVAILALSLLALRAAVLWLPGESDGGMQIEDHAWLFFTLALCYFASSAVTAIGIWMNARWATPAFVAWAGSLLALGAVLATGVNPFGRDTAGHMMARLFVLGVIAAGGRLAMGFRRPARGSTS